MSSYTRLKFRARIRTLTGRDSWIIQWSEEYGLRGRYWVRSSSVTYIDESQLHTLPNNAGAHLQVGEAERAGSPSLAGNELAPARDWLSTQSVYRMNKPYGVVLHRGWVSVLFV